MGVLGQGCLGALHGCLAQLLALLVDDLQQFGLAQQTRLTGSSLDAVEGVLGGLREHGIGCGVAQSLGNADLLGRLPGHGSGLVSGACVLVLQTGAADLDRAEDGLEGVRNATTAAELFAALAAAKAEQQL